MVIAQMKFLNVKMTLTMRVVMIPITTPSLKKQKDKNKILQKQRQMNFINAWHAHSLHHHPSNQYQFEDFDHSLDEYIMPPNVHNDDCFNHCNQNDFNCNNRHRYR